MVGPDLDGYAHRYKRDGLIVDVLAPEGIKPPPNLGAGLKAIGVPGGSQAITRSETVTVIVEGRSFELRRPTLLGAVLIKARSLMVHSDPETQRENLLRLLALIEYPRERRDCSWTGVATLRTQKARVRTPPLWLPR